MQPEDGTLVGRVVGLWRYPVKSMGAESLPQVNAGWFGLDGDRRWAFVRSGQAQSGFPWLTLRDRADMRQFMPTFVDSARPNGSATEVVTPNGTRFDITDPALARELWPKGAHVVRYDRGIFDTFPLSLISTRTIAQLGERVGQPLDVQRFRPNLLIEATGETPFPEDAWVGQVLRIGAARIRVDVRDRRCVVISIDSDTAQSNRDVLRTVTRERDGCLGVYGTTVDPGSVCVGDDVWLEGARD
ncbi:MAG: MOSC domain-containing protein [Pseudomonadota bacterium]